MDETVETLPPVQQSLTPVGLVTGAVDDGPEPLSRSARLGCFNMTCNDVLSDRDQLTDIRSSSTLQLGRWLL